MRAQTHSVLSRHECKYLVPIHVLDQVREYMRPFMRADAFAADKPGCRYRVSSVYLDSPDLALYKMTAEGNQNRFKLRMRWYDEDPDQPVFMEIKRRLDQIVRKSRTAVDLELAAVVLQSTLRPTSRESTGLAGDTTVEDFAMLARRSAARPTMLVRYWREPYESLGPDPLRITFDTSLDHATTRNGALLGRGEELAWRLTPQDGAIIEIKFTERYPSWVGNMIAELQLQRQSVPKYCLAVEHAMRSGDYSSAAAQARSAGPHGRASWGV